MTHNADGYHTAASGSYQRQVIQRKRDDKNDREQEKRGDLPRFSAQIL